MRRYESTLTIRLGGPLLRVRWPLAFAGLFFVSTFSRAVLISVIPLKAHALLGDAQAVSVLYFVVATLGIATSISVPALLHRVGARFAFLGGVLLMVVSAFLLSSGRPWCFVAGMLLHFVSVAVTDVPLNAFILSETPRRELTRFEPLRIFYSVLAFAIGPWLGVFLGTRVAEALPCVLAAAAALLSALHFHWLGLAEARLARGVAPPVNPLRHVRRFFVQPRMRLAWALAVARSSWWLTFVVYTPLLAKTSGLGELTGAAVVSIGTAWVLTVTLWGRVGRRYGLRPLLTTGFLATAGLSVLAGACAGWPWAAMILLVWTALAATVLDGAGNVPFLRAVRPMERSEMTGVYLTYRDISQIGAPGIFSLLLGIFQLPVVFVAAGTWMLLTAGLCRYIPRRM